MSNTITDPTWVKAEPNASAEFQVGDADPGGATDVINRPAKGIQRILRRLIDALLDNTATDYTDVATTTAFADRIRYNGLLGGRLQRDSATQVSLQRLDGRWLPIKDATGWKLMAIPQAGVLLANTGLAASTVYNIYAYDNAGTLTLVADATARATDVDTGVPIKTGDATRTLVGKIRTETSTPGQFVDSGTQRFTISWFNRRPLGLAGNFTVNRTTTSTTYVELNSEIRIEFLVWGDEAVAIGASGSVANSTTTNQACFTSVGFDGTTGENTQSAMMSASIGAKQPFALSLVKAGLAEGYHYATLLGAMQVGTDTGTWYGGAVATLGVASLTVNIRG